MVAAIGYCANLSYLRLFKLVQGHTGVIVSLRRPELLLDIVYYVFFGLSYAPFCQAS
jgi:hypothetical protein